MSNIVVEYNCYIFSYSLCGVLAQVVQSYIQKYKQEDSGVPPNRKLFGGTRPAKQEIISRDCPAKQEIIWRDCPAKQLSPKKFGQEKILIQIILFQKNVGQKNVGPKKLGLSVLFGWGRGGGQNLSLQLGLKPFKRFLWLVFCLFYTYPVVGGVVRIRFYSYLSQAVLGLRLSLAIRGLI